MLDSPEALFIIGVLAGAIRLATPLILGSLSGVLSERSGVVNLSIEGMMLLGAFAGAVAGSATGDLRLAVAAAMGVGVLLALLLSWLTVSLMLDQIVVGMAINILAFGLTGYLSRAIFGVIGSTSIGTARVVRIPFLADLPVLGPVLFRATPIVYLALVLVPLVHILIFHTRFGLRTRAVGENPQAADSAGVDVYRVRYLNVLMSGLLAGLAGGYIITEVGNFSEGMTAGKGFISLAALIFGKWTPFGALGAALLFGLADSLQIKLQIVNIGIPHQFLLMTPYLLTLVVLAGFIGRAVPPAADGKPYVKE